MAYLVFMFVTLALLAGFIALTVYETRRGTRLFAPARARLDARTEHLQYLVEHVDFGAFLRNESRRLVVRAGHDSAAFTLMLVRAVERFLTRLVRYLRRRTIIEAAPPPGEAREFVRTLSDFKTRLSASPPDIPDINAPG